MAAIDKIYGTQGQYLELKKWAEDNNYQGILDYLYPEDGYKLDDRPISNFPENIDRSLLMLCPLKWVTDYIKGQYGIEDYPNEEMIDYVSSFDLDGGDKLEQDMVLDECCQGFADMFAEDIGTMWREVFEMTLEKAKDVTHKS